MSFAKLKIRFAVAILFSTTLALSGCTIVTFDNKIPNSSLEERVIELYNRIAVMVSAINNLSSWVMVALVFSLVGFFALSIYLAYRISQLNKTLTEELTAAQTNVKQLSQDLWKIRERNSLLIAEDRQTKDTLNLLVEILYEVAPTKYKKQIDISRTRSRMMTSKDRDDVESFVDELINAYQSAGGVGYIPLNTIRHSLGYIKNFETLLQESRKKFPSLIHLETTNQGQTLIKITEGGKNVTPSID